MEFLSLINVGLTSVLNLPKLPKLKKVSLLSNASELWAGSELPRSRINDHFHDDLTKPVNLEAVFLLLISPAIRVKIRGYKNMECTHFSSFM